MEKVEEILFEVCDLGTSRGSDDICTPGHPGVANFSSDL